MPEELEAAISEVASIDPESLVRREDLGPLNFEGGVPHFERLIRFYRLLSQYSFEHIPKGAREELLNQTVAARSHFRGISGFTGTDPNASNQRDALISAVSTRFYEDTYNRFRKHLLFDVENLAFGAIREDALKTSEAISELKRESEKRLKSIDVTLDAVREASAEAGVSQQAIYFKRQAKRHFYASLGWLVSTIAFGVITLIYVLWRLGPQLSVAIQDLRRDVPAGEVSMVSLMPVIGSRIIILFVLSFGLAWSAKHFSANQHNLVVNRHRQNCLSTFQEFVEAAKGDTDTKNAILLQATQSIFTPQPTGFSKHDTEVRSGSQVFEIFRNLKGDE